jgi:hypothetical protein
MKSVYELVKTKTVKIDGADTLVSEAKVGKFILSTS